MSPSAVSNTTASAVSRRASPSSTVSRSSTVDRRSGRRAPGRRRAGSRRARSIVSARNVAYGVAAAVVVAVRAHALDVGRERRGHRVPVVRGERRRGSARTTSRANALVEHRERAPGRAAPRRSRRGPAALIFFAVRMMHAGQRRRVEAGDDVGELGLEEHEAERVLERLHLGVVGAGRSLRTIACTRAIVVGVVARGRRAARRARARAAPGATCASAGSRRARRAPTSGARSSAGSDARAPRAAAASLASGRSRCTHSVTSSACSDLPSGPVRPRTVTTFGSSALPASIAAIARAKRSDVGHRRARAQLAAEVAGEPVERAAPRVGRGVGVVRRARVAVEAVLGVGVAHDLGVDRRRGERGAQLLDVVDRDRPVEVAEQAEPRRLQRRARGRPAPGTAGSGRSRCRRRRSRPPRRARARGATRNETRPPKQKPDEADLRVGEAAPRGGASSVASTSVRIAASLADADEVLDDRAEVVVARTLPPPVRWNMSGATAW